METTAVPGGSVATDETSNLISADKVIGTNVYNRAGEKLGSVYALMLNKLNGQVAYAVMSFGGFLGIGESYHPLPWRILTYDTRMGGYVVDLDRRQLEDAPTYTAASEPDWRTFRSASTRITPSPRSKIDSLTPYCRARGVNGAAGHARGQPLAFSGIFARSRG